MKYIRTKDGKLRNEKEWKDLLDYAESNCQDIDDMVIKQADNIQELCDEYIWVTPQGERHIKPKTNDGLWLASCDYKNGHLIYGAIWTNRGLIYVAIMSVEGDWELL